jgi:hypothetical protein
MAISDFDQRLKTVHAAIEDAMHPDREGPYGLFDYGTYGDPVPHQVRDFRDARSDTYGDCVFRTVDRDEAMAVYERLTQEHVAIAAMTAVLKVLGLRPLQYQSVAATQEQRQEGRDGPLYSQGDMQLAWLCVGDLHQHQFIPNPSDLGALAARDRKAARKD